MTTEHNVEVEAEIGGVPVLRQADWVRRFPWLVQGVTVRRAGFDFGRAPDGDEGPVNGETAALAPRDGAWGRLRAGAGARQLFRLRQVHGARVLVVPGEHPGPERRPEADALASGRAGLLLAVTIADCVPVFAADPTGRTAGLAHAGWRGIAAGVVEGLIRRMSSELGSRPDELHVHLGPAICGGCYEVGPEVPAALGVAGSPSHVDLRAVAARRAEAAGVRRSLITRSALCTACRRDLLFSYRAGDRTGRSCAFAGRQES